MTDFAHREVAWGSAWSNMALRRGRPSGPLDGSGRPISISTAKLETL